LEAELEAELASFNARFLLILFTNHSELQNRQLLERSLSVWRREAGDDSRKRQARAIFESLGLGVSMEAYLAGDPPGRADL